MLIFSDLRLLNVISFIFFVFLFSLINAFILLLFCYPIFIGVTKQIAIFVSVTK